MNAQNPNNTNPLKNHPDCELIPEMDAATFAGLVADIKENGVRVPIWLYDGMILDGRNRYRACRELGIECPSIETHGDARRDVLSLNVYRRHLDESQRAMIAARMATMKHGGDRRSKDQDASLHVDSVTKTEAAQTMNVSPRSVSSAKKVLEGGPALVAAVVSGAMSVSKAARAVGQSTKGPKRRTTQRRTKIARDPSLDGAANLAWLDLERIMDHGLLKYDPNKLSDHLSPFMGARLKQWVPAMIEWLQRFPK